MAARRERMEAASKDALKDFVKEASHSILEIAASFVGATVDQEVLQTIADLLLNLHEGVDGGKGFAKSISDQVRTLRSHPSLKEGMLSSIEMAWAGVDFSTTLKAVTEGVMKLAGMKLGEGEVSGALKKVLEHLPIVSAAAQFLSNAYTTWHDIESWKAQLQVTDALYNCFVEKSEYRAAAVGIQTFESTVSQMQRVVRYSASLKSKPVTDGSSKKAQASLQSATQNYLSELCAQDGSICYQMLLNPDVRKKLQTYIGFDKNYLDTHLSYLEILVSRGPISDFAVTAEYSQEVAISQLGFALVTKLFDEATKKETDPPFKLWACRICLPSYVKDIATSDASTTEHSTQLRLINNKILNFKRERFRMEERDGNVFKLFTLRSRTAFVDVQFQYVPRGTETSVVAAWNTLGYTVHEAVAMVGSKTLTLFGMQLDANTLSSATDLSEVALVDITSMQERVVARTEEEAVYILVSQGATCRPQVKSINGQHLYQFQKDYAEYDVWGFPSNTNIIEGITGCTFHKPEHNRITVATKLCLWSKEEELGETRCKLLYGLSFEEKNAKIETGFNGVALKALVFNAFSYRENRKLLADSDVLKSSYNNQLKSLQVSLCDNLIPSATNKKLADDVDLVKACDTAWNRVRSGCYCPHIKPEGTELYHLKPQMLGQLENLIKAATGKHLMAPRGDNLLTDASQKCHAFMKVKFTRKCSAKEKQVLKINDAISDYVKIEESCSEDLFDIPIGSVYIVELWNGRRENTEDIADVNKAVFRDLEKDRFFFHSQRFYGAERSAGVLVRIWVSFDFRAIVEAGSDICRRIPAAMIPMQTEDP
eukprot:GILJ01022117.1.p1 GENE.GILJ01022117.1~~GILJ01022117.1.p1  ORF type:complete len:969 (+),score=125.56 GILJ01022117.1:434-2908(+)